MVYLAKCTSNFSEHVFLPTNKRESVKFSEGNSLSQVYDANSVQCIGYYKSPIEAVNAQSDLIKEHVDRRIQLFFQQAILVHNMPFHFKANGAEDQIGVGQTLKLSNKVSYKTQAAHSSTFPCLYAYPKDANGKVDRSRGFVYLRGSHGYKQHNATCELPESVNKTDTYIDGKTNQEMLRKSAIRILNKTAVGEFSPVEATIKFLSVFKKVLKTSKDNLAEGGLRHYIIKKIYLPQVSEVLKEVKVSDDIFDQILGVNLDTSDDESKLREIVYRQKYRLIQEVEFIESKIAKRILSAQNKISNKQNKSLKSLDKSLRYVLLDETKGNQRKRLEKLFCTSIYQLQASIKCNNNKLQKLKLSMDKFAKKHEAEITALRGDLCLFFKEIETLEVEFKSKLFKGLRTDLKEWSQKEFVVAFKALYSKEPMSQSMVSRLEQPARTNRLVVYSTPENQRKKEISINKAIEISNTFGVDIGLFLPCLITSITSDD